MKNLLKFSIFSRKNSSTRYQFRQARQSIRDPLLYTFDQDEMELESVHSDDEISTASVRTRRAIRQIADSGGSIVIVEKAVLPNESIQAFAIRFRVPVSQLKRLNNLQNDQDFYALSTCRVPVRRFGILHESTSNLLIDLDQDSTTRISLPVTHLTQQNHLAFLNAMDEDLAKMRTRIENIIERPSPIQAQETRIGDQSAQVKPSGADWTCDESDWSCKLWQIILILLLILLIPFIYVYFYLKSRHNHHQ